MASCTYCSRPDYLPARVLSIHRTADGLTVWTRCRCGSLQARVVEADEDRVVARGCPSTLITHSAGQHRSRRGSQARSC
ncbi:MAG: hypothetical protein GEV04_23275 [Actinophytocola sp.]|nr:hypothetical protein [Actinophytocola sp.]